MNIQQQQQQHHHYIISNDDSILLHKPKSKPFHRRTQSNTAYDLGNIFNITPKEIDTNIKEIIENHNILGSLATLKAIELANINVDEKQIIIDDIDDIPKSNGLIVAKKHTNPLNYIKKRNLSCVNTFIHANTLPIKKINLLNQPQQQQQQDDMTIGLNTIPEKRNIGNYDPESMDYNNNNNNIKQILSKDGLIKCLIDENDDDLIDKENHHIINNNNNGISRPSNEWIIDKKYRFIEELQKKLSSPTQSINQKQIYNIKNGMNPIPFSLTSSNNLQQVNNNNYALNNHNHQIKSNTKPQKSDSRSRLNISPQLKAPNSKRGENTKEIGQVGSFTKYFSSSNTNNNNNMVLVDNKTMTTSIITDAQLNKKNSCNGNNTINNSKNNSIYDTCTKIKNQEKKALNMNGNEGFYSGGGGSGSGSGSNIIRNYENIIEDLTDKVNTLTIKSRNFEEQIKDLMEIIEQLTNTNKELYQKQLEQEYKINKLENKLNDETYNKKGGRCICKLNENQDNNNNNNQNLLKQQQQQFQQQQQQLQQLQLQQQQQQQQDFSANQILNSTTDNSSIESPNGDQSNIGIKNNAKKILNNNNSNGLFEQNDNLLPSNNNKSTRIIMPNESNKHITEKSLGLYRTQIKKIYFEDNHKKSLTKLK